MLVFGRNATGSFVLGYGARNLDKILLGWRYGASQLGYYQRAYYLFALPATELTEALKNVATSVLSKLRGEPQRYVEYYIRALSVVCFLGMPISFFFMATAEDLILGLFGAHWEQSVGLFRILAAGTGVWVVYSTKYWLHASLGRSDRLIRWGVIDLAVTATAVAVGLWYGPKGVAFAYICAVYLLTMFGLSYAGQPIGLKFRTVIAAIWAYFVAAAIAGFICWFTLRVWGSGVPRLYRVVLGLVIYCSCYLAAVVILCRSVRPIKDLLILIRDVFSKRI